MCNFVIRPIKSYATVDYAEMKGVNGGEQNEVIKRGEYITVKYVTGDDVFGHLNGDESKPVTIPVSIFVHSFTANVDDVTKVKEEETSWYPKKKEAKEKKDSKKES